MTTVEAIKEAIKHAEGVMNENLEKTKDRNASDPIAINCFECAEKHQQVAEWLKDYKRLLEQEPCDDCVSRQAVQTELRNCEVVNVRDENDNLIGYYNADTVDSIVRNLPPVTPQPKMGRWISFGAKGEIDGQIVRTFTCSECGAISIFRVTNGNIVNGDLCPNCGAKMQEV